VSVTECSADFEVTLMWYLDEVPLLHRDIFCLLIVYTEYMWTLSGSLLLPQ
jgi:hypothetical protein